MAFSGRAFPSNFLPGPRTSEQRGGSAKEEDSEGGARAKEKSRKKLCYQNGLKPKGRREGIPETKAILLGAGNATGSLSRMLKDRGDTIMGLPKIIEVGGRGCRRKKQLKCGVPVEQKGERKGELTCQTNQTEGKKKSQRTI